MRRRLKQNPSKLNVHFNTKLATLHISLNDHRGSPEELRNCGMTCRSNCSVLNHALAKLFVGPHFLPVTHVKCFAARSGLMLTIPCSGFRRSSWFNTTLSSPINPFSHLEAGNLCLWCAPQSPQTMPAPHTLPNCCRLQQNPPHGNHIRTSLLPSLSRALPTLTLEHGRCK